MEKKFKIAETILVSDLDGTILPHGGIISRKNLLAIEKFRSLGGIFTVATGRSPLQAKEYLDILGVNTPMIANNGTNIYDPKTNKNLWVKNLDVSYKRIISDIASRFSEVGIITVSSDDRYEVLVENRLVSEFRLNDAIKFYDTNKLTDDCCKVLFLVEDRHMHEVSSYVINQDYSEESFVISAPFCLEMMPKGISKGYPFEKLLEFYQKKLANSVAIGDYNNDIEMIQKAGFGVAVSNALENVKKEASHIVKSCEEDGIADLIEYLINN